MKKFFLSTSMVVSFIVVVNFSYAQEKQAVVAAKKVVTNTAPAATKVSPAMATSTKAVTTEITSTTQASTVADVISSSKDHTTLLAALKSAGLLETLAGSGPFTVFAPTNDAFAKIPAAGLEVLLKPEYKMALSKILTGHVVSGTLKSTDVLDAIKTGGGKAVLTTLSGDKITASEEKGKIKIVDAAGNIAFISKADIVAENGIIHSIDGTLGTQ